MHSRSPMHDCTERWRIRRSGGEISLVWSYLNSLGLVLSLHKLDVRACYAQNVAPAHAVSFSSLSLVCSMERDPVLRSLVCCDNTHDVMSYGSAVNSRCLQRARHSRRPVHCLRTTCRLTTVHVVAGWRECHGRAAVSKRYLRSCSHHQLAGVAGDWRTIGSSLSAVP